jgi:EpsI family protein
LITSTNVLVSSSDPTWSVISRGTGTAKTMGTHQPVRTAVILSKEGGIDSRFVFWHWYWINGEVTTSDIAAKLMTALARLRGQGDDSAVVMLYAPGEIAPGSLAAFAEAAGPQIRQLLEATREAR